MAWCTFMRRARHIAIAGRGLEILLISFACVTETVHAVPPTNHHVAEPQASPEPGTPRTAVNDTRRNQEDTRKLETALAGGEFSEVLRMLESYSEAVRSDPGMRAIRAAALIGQGDVAESQKAIRSLLAGVDVRPQDIAVPAAMYLRVGRPKEAMRLCQNGLIRDARSSSLLFEAGRAWDAVGDNETARIYFQNALEFSRASDGVDEGLLTDAIVNSLLKTQRYEQAGAAVMARTKVGPNPFINDLALAKYHASKGQFDKALSLLDRPRTMDPGLAAYLSMAQVQVLAGAPVKALGLLESAKVVYPIPYSESAGALLESLCRLLMNDAPTALTLLTKIEQTGRSTATLPLVKATILMSMGDERSARKELARAPMPFVELAGFDSIVAHLAPRDLGPSLAHAYFCFDQGYFGQAIEVLGQSLVTHPDNVFLHLLLAESRSKLGEHRRALDAYQRAATLMPESLSLQYSLALTSQKAGAVSEAIQQYAKLVKSRTDFLAATLSYGELLETTGQWEAARSVYEYPLNFEPDSLSLLSSLGWALLHLDDFQAIGPVLRSLKKLVPPDAAVSNHLEGWLAYRQGHYANAVRCLTVALDGAPGDPEICYHLGRAHLAIGERAKAFNLLEQALFFDRQKEKYGASVAEALAKEAR